MERKRISTDTVWERTVGYSRAIRVGNHIHTSGTTAWNDAGEVVGVGDAYAQTVQILRNIETALVAAGANMSDVVRTRIFVLNIDANWEAVGRAHGEFFREVRPVTTMVEVSRLINPDMLVEIEVDAIVG